MNFVDQIEQLSEHPHVKGVRRILHEAPDDLSQSDLFIENIRHLPDYDLSFDLCLRADQLHLGVDLAQRAPDVTFILDHCGNPDIRSEEHTSELQSLMRISYAVFCLKKKKQTTIRN